MNRFAWYERYDNDFTIILNSIRKQFLQLGGAAYCGLLIVSTALSLGCSIPNDYRYGRKKNSLEPFTTPPVSMTDGTRDHPKLDNLESNLFTPIETMRDWVKKPGPNDPTLEMKRNEAVTDAVQYLTRNQMTDVHVAVRDYSPSDQWKRLRENRDISPFWKYTDGSLRVLFSTVLPERVFRVDRFNPHTKTLHLNSGSSARSVYAAATAKEILSSDVPGVYSASQYLPIVPIYQQNEVTKDSILYARTEQNWEMEKGLYPHGYAAIGGSVLSDVYSLAPMAVGTSPLVAPAVTLAGRLVGRGIGEIKADQREAELLRR